MIHIQLQNIHKTLDGNAVLKGVDLAINKGEILAVVGPSGSGKSTLLRCLNRLLDCEQGEILLNEKTILELLPPELRRRVSLVHQEAIMLKGTVQENVAYGLKIQEKEDDGLVKTALISAGLTEDYLLRDAEKLSGGERQRVALARSMVLGPEALLLDEPTASVDPRLKDEMEKTIISRTLLG